MATTLEEINAVAVKTWLTKESINVSLNNFPWLYELKQKGRFRASTSSEVITANLPFALPAVKGTDGSGTGRTVHNTRLACRAVESWRTLVVRTMIARSELDLRKSVEAMAQLVLGKMVASQSGMLNTINGHAFGSGTADNGLALTGLAMMVSKLPSIGVYAGLDPEVTPQWRNFAVNTNNPLSGLPNKGQALSKDNILPIIDYVATRLMINGRGPTHLLVGNRYFNMIQEAVNTKQMIISNSETGIAGVRTIQWAGIKVICVGGLQRDSGLNRRYSGLDEDTMYLVSIDDIDLVYHDPFYDNPSEAKSLGLKTSDINAIVYPEVNNGMILHKDSSTLDYYVHLVFKGNFILGDRQIHGVIYEG